MADLHQMETVRMVEYGVVVPEYGCTVKIYCFEDECDEMAMVLETYGRFVHEYALNWMHENPSNDGYIRGCLLIEYVHQQVDGQREEMQRREEAPFANVDAADVSVQEQESATRIKMAKHVVHSLLDLIEQKWSQLDSNRCAKKPIWRAIAEQLRLRNPNDPVFTPDQCCTKWKGLQATYHRRQQARKKSGSKPLNNWEFEDQVHRLIGPRPVNNTNTVSSLSTLSNQTQRRSVTVANGSNAAASSAVLCPATPVVTNAPGTATRPPTPVAPLDQNVVSVISTPASATPSSTTSSTEAVGQSLAVTPSTSTGDVTPQGSSSTSSTLKSKKRKRECLIDVFQAESKKAEEREGKKLQMLEVARKERKSFNKKLLLIFAAAFQVDPKAFESDSDSDSDCVEQTDKDKPADKDNGSNPQCPIEILIHVISFMQLSDVFSLYNTSKAIQARVQDAFALGDYWKYTLIDEEFITFSLLKFVNEYASEIRKFQFFGGPVMCWFCTDFLPTLLSNLCNATYIHLGGNRYVDDVYFLLTIKNLQYLNIQNCTHIDPESVATCVPQCVSLKKLIMKDIPAIKQRHVVRACRSLKQLTYLDASGNGEMCFTNVQMLIDSCTSLLSFNCEVFRPLGHLDHWERVIIHCRRVTFGRAFLRRFPKSGELILQRRYLDNMRAEGK